MFRDFRLWIIIGLVVIVIILVITRPKKQPDFIEGKIEYEENMEEHKKDFDSARKVIDSVVLQRRLDSIRAAERELKYKANISRLQGKIRDMDLSKSTDKQLDSLINILYPL